MLKNAIVLMFDSLQFNYVGCYGNEWIQTPNMDRLAKEGALFENAYTEGLPTVPCRRSMHTGRFTVQKAGWVALSMEDTTIADLCWGRPIDTALIFDCPMYRLPKFGYTRGFDKLYFTHGHEGDDCFFENDKLIHYDPADFEDKGSIDAYRSTVGEKAAETLEHELVDYLKQRQFWKGEKDRYCYRTMTKAIEYLEQVDRNKQFYLWIDSFDPHEPWDPPSVYKYRPDGTYDPDMKCPYDPDYELKDQPLPISGKVAGIYTEEQCHHVRMLYAELVTLCDKQVGRLMDSMRRLGLEENTMLFMVSDHGEPFGEGEHGHGIMRKCRPWPYEELAHVPMIIRVPGAKPGQRIKAYVQSCDVAPTVCDWLGIGVHPAMQGKSLLPVVMGETDKVHDFCIAGYHPYSCAIWTDDWSYIHWFSNAAETNMRDDFYAAHIDGSHIQATTDNEFVTNRTWAGAGHKVNEVEARYKDQASLDGADQWTCTPSSTTEVPATDELYDRHNDQFQLHNVIAEHPDVAKKLYMMLTDYLDDLKNS